MQHICQNCLFRIRFCSPPSPGEADDGVECASLTMAELIDANQPPGGTIKDYIGELRETGCINIWRVERVALESEPSCECWKLGEILCPQCSDGLLIRATHEYNIGFDDDQKKWTKDDGLVTYTCSNCGYEFDPSEIDEILKQVDEL